MSTLPVSIAQRRLRGSTTTLRTEKSVSGESPALAAASG
jgi:hypothetical protein